MTKALKITFVWNGGRIPRIKVYFILYFYCNDLRCTNMLNERLKHSDSMNEMLFHFFIYVKFGEKSSQEKETEEFDSEVITSFRP